MKMRAFSVGLCLVILSGCYGWARASLVTVNISDCMKDKGLQGMLWQCSNTLAVYQQVGEDWHATTTNINQRVVESNQRAEETHAFWKQVRQYVLWGLALGALIFREHAQKMILGALKLGMTPITLTKKKKG